MTVVGVVVIAIGGCGDGGAQRGVKVASPAYRTDSSVEFGQPGLPPEKFRVAQRIEVGSTLRSTPFDIVVNEKTEQGCLSRLAGYDGIAGSPTLPQDQDGCRVVYQPNGERLWVDLDSEEVYRAVRLQQWQYSKAGRNAEPGFIAEQCAVIRSRGRRFAVGREGRDWTCKQAVKAMQRWLDTNEGNCFHEGDEYWCDNSDEAAVVGSAKEVKAGKTRSKLRRLEMKLCALAVRGSSANVLVHGVSCEFARGIALAQVGSFSITGFAVSAHGWDCGLIRVKEAPPFLSLCRKKGDRCDTGDPFVLLVHDDDFNVDQRESRDQDDEIQITIDRDGGFYHPRTRQAPCVKLHAGSAKFRNQPTISTGL